ncbi:MAG: hypothetical protein A3F72_10645 [Bacteroidetes bacterium RIFCSPLOWO2_12_FULL_35_15]|nr:MAG: hypothetical protein A3F72_10645 [Bacteroidetes bacterium RIFCSPLOWO2_12_FULL_35_15]
MPVNSYIKTLDEHTTYTLQLVKSCPPTLQADNINDTWSILQILEHICMTEKLICMLLSKPADKTAETNELFGNDKIKKMVVENRGYKVKAPESLIPKGDIKDVKEFEKVFLQQRDLLKQEIQTGKITFDNRIHKHPVLGEMTIIDWLNFLIHHTQRHLEQIKDSQKN